MVDMDENLYPIEYDDKFWSEEDVNDVFKAFYHSKLSLDNNISVYVSEGVRVCPDGKWI